MQKIYSVLIWSGIVILIGLWLPLLAFRRITDRTTGHYKTGLLFRKLGLAVSRINPNWHVYIEGHEKIDDRKPYIVVSNHLSNADIPLISNLPWEMKWVAKKELFEIPVLGWMMKMAGDIEVDRSSTSKKVSTLKKCKYYLDKKISVMFFPEGTRSRSGKLNRFAPGAFDLAIKEKADILPIVLDGTQDCLPKRDWVFKPDVQIKMKVLSPVDTTIYSHNQADELMIQVRGMMARQLAEWRQQELSEVDATLPQSH